MKTAFPFAGAVLLSVAIHAGALTGLNGRAARMIGFVIGFEHAVSLLTAKVKMTSTR